MSPHTTPALRHITLISYHVHATACHAYIMQITPILTYYHIQCIVTRLWCRIILISTHRKRTWNITPNITPIYHDITHLYLLIWRYIRFKSHHFMSISRFLFQGPPFWTFFHATDGYSTIFRHIAPILRHIIFTSHHMISYHIRITHIIRIWSKITHITPISQRITSISHHSMLHLCHTHQFDIA